MKNIRVKNTHGVRIIVRTLKGDDGLPLSFGPGEEKDVSEALMAHPVLKRYFGEGRPLQVVQAGAVKKTPAPAPAPTAPVEKTPPSDPEEPEEPEEEKEDLRDVYLRAPGITENNVDEVLEAFPTLEELADADEADLIDCGVSKSFVNRVLEWAAS